MTKKLRNFILMFKGWYRSTSDRRVFFIPVGNTTDEETEKSIRELMVQYHEQIEFPEGIVLKSNNSETWYSNNSIGL